MEFWCLASTSVTSAAEQAVAAESAGWDGGLVPETPSLMGDAYVTLTAAAVATHDLKLGTGVTNPFTRHPRSRRRRSLRCRSFRGAARCMVSAAVTTHWHIWGWRLHPRRSSRVPWPAAGISPRRTGSL